jgi:acetyl-CoA synthetase
MRQHGFASIEAFHERAVADPEWYWREVIDDLNIEFDEPFSQVLDSSRGREFPQWFTGGALNVNASCLDRWAEGAAGAKTAIIWENEAGECTETSYAELYEAAVALAKFLTANGVAAGDAVGLFMPMVAETAAAFLACARIGAIAVTAYSGYGPEALASRFALCDARVVICADGFHRKGSAVVMKEPLDVALRNVPSVKRVVILPHIGAAIELLPDRDVLWGDALRAGRSSAAHGSYVPLNPNDPLLIAYTSGTTGRPKGIVHSHGGFLAKVAHDFGYLFDVQEEDIVFWPTDLGWLMAPIIMLGTFACHSTALFYEGVPDHPAPDRLWKVAERHRVTFLGTSPTATRTLMGAGDKWATGHDLSAIRAFASVGEPWNPKAWNWLFDVVGRRRVPILNYCGGTEVTGGIVACYTILPMKPAGFAGPVVGVDADVVDPAGNPVREAVGELVVRNLSPGMTHSFWKDDVRYLETYWSQMPGLWVQGDLASIDADGHWYVTGRSDDTIKVAGKRIGPAEVESAVVAHPAVVEAAAIGVPDEQKGQSISCFAVTRAGTASTDQLAEEIKETVQARLGKTMVPRSIFFVDDLPKTRTGKLVRRAIRAHHLNEPQGDLSSLDNPAALEAIPLRST